MALVTDIPTPYMLEVLKALGDLVDLTVVFCAQTGIRGMPWEADAKLPFDHHVIDGLTVRSDAPDRPDYFLSPRLLGALAKSGAEAVISFGFSIPTAYAAAYCRLRRVPLIIYSDGTSEYESGLGRHQMVARAILLRAASACVAKSKPAAERFVELGVRPERVFLAPHSSTLDRLWRIAEERKYERDDTVTVLDRRPPDPPQGSGQAARGDRRRAQATAEDPPGRGRNGAGGGAASQARRGARPRCRVRGLRRSRGDGRRATPRPTPSPFRRSSTRSGSCCSRRRPRGYRSWPPITRGRPGT